MLTLRCLGALLIVAGCTGKIHAIESEDTQGEGSGDWASDADADTDTDTDADADTDTDSDTDTDADTDTDTDTDTAASSDADGGPPTGDSGGSYTEMTFTGTLTVTGTGTIDSIVGCAITVWPWAAFGSSDVPDHTSGLAILGEEDVTCPSAIDVAEPFSVTLPVEDVEGPSDGGVVGKIVVDMIREQGWEHNPISAGGADTVSDVHITVDISGPPGEGGP
jgi:hypothetical protein